VNRARTATAETARVADEVRTAAARVAAIVAEINATQGDTRVAFAEMAARLEEMARRLDHERENNAKPESVLAAESEERILKGLAAARAAKGLPADHVAPVPTEPAAAGAMSEVRRALQGAQRGADFSFAGQVFLAKIVDVYDGDTVRVKFVYRGEVMQWRARMAGYDSPEMKPLLKNADREAEKRAAVEARDALSRKIGDACVWISCGEFDKYGRLLVTVFKVDPEAGPCQGDSINDWMIAEGHGVPYAGRTKAPFRPKSVPGTA
jgi:endonuclease YncB( thermonuclease family)